MAMEEGPGGTDIWCLGFISTETGFLYYLIQNTLKSNKNRCFPFRFLGSDSIIGRLIHEICSFETSRV